MIRLIFSIILVTLLFGCRVDVPQTQPIVEQSLGKVTFIWQNESDDSYSAWWYIHELDTLIETFHEGSGWDITDSKFHSFNEVEQAANKILLDRLRQGHRPPPTTNNPTEPEHVQEKITSKNPWGEW